jgi:hypothetical protein
MICGACRLGYESEIDVAGRWRTVSWHEVTEEIQTCAVL